MSGGSLDPAVLDKLSGLSLVARTLVEGFMAGHHRSPHRGSSVEFAEHREYVPGDELRRIDWRVFARSERLVVKEFVEETNLTLSILVDASESMAYGSGSWTKFDYARWCAAGLAHLTLTQRDTVGLVLFDESERSKVPPANGAAQQKAVIETLEGAEAGGPTRIGEVLGWLATRLRRKGIVAVFSDFLDDPDAITAGLRRLKYDGHEPILFQVLDHQELAFDFETMLKLDGLEGAGTLKIDPKAIRAAYREELGRHNDELARQARALDLDYVLLDTSRGVDAVLSTYLARRSVRAGGRRR
ncbi:MAG: DUF58 domain-containing protein [Planctomycetota bacterium]|jgi:uncharacterized protein (DUF58 family)|nr:DUF58 domain-containing protein [Planctomycetota bacterium]MDP6763388.1 DUF58 domain-containing protein [Planctomycetota bacterium]MDP6990268.1 DUF58 domain-containing protein [Planctomycetota bacterium]